VMKRIEKLVGDNMWRVNFMTKLDELISEYVFDDKVNILPYSSDTKYFDAVFKEYVGYKYAHIVYSNYGYWDIKVEGGFITDLNLMQALCLATLRRYMTKDEITDKLEGTLNADGSLDR